MIVTTYCKDKCCAIVTTTRYLSRQNYHQKNKIRAGALIYDSETERILLIQSRRMKWGLPKGSYEDCDGTIEIDGRSKPNLRATALREVREETGIIIPPALLDDSSVCRVYRCLYYYVELPVDKVTLSDSAMNDSTGMMWIRPHCLVQLIRAGKIDVNAHFRHVFREVFKMTI